MMEEYVVTEIVVSAFVLDSKRDSNWIDGGYESNLEDIANRYGVEPVGILHYSLDEHKIYAESLNHARIIAEKYIEGLKNAINPLRKPSLTFNVQKKT